MATAREQELVDIMFQCILVRHDPNYRAHFDAKTQEEMAEWVTKQLAGCGFSSTACGLSWAVLD